MKKDRIEHMKAFITSRGTVSMDDLFAAFPVSMNTIRRDLRTLQEEGLIYKVYGGVVASASSSPPGTQGTAPDCAQPFDARDNEHLQAKKAIGALAAAQIDEGDIVFIDSGTTTPWIVDAIGNKAVTIVTTNLQVLVRASRCENVRLMALPGVYMPGSNSFSGTETVEALSKYNITKAFLAAWGFSLEHGATVVSPWEFENKKLVISRARETYLLIGSQKFDLVTMLTYCPPDGIGAVITECQPPEKFTRFFGQHGIRLLLPS